MIRMNRIYKGLRWVRSLSRLPIQKSLGAGRRSNLGKIEIGPGLFIKCGKILAVPLTKYPVQGIFSSFQVRNFDEGD
jgi:hypothetical protein